MRTPDRRTIALLAPALLAGTLAVAMTSAVDALALRIVLQAVAVAAFIVMAWRIGAGAGDAETADVVPMSESQRRAIASDRRKPTFDRDTGLFANWYFRLRVEEEIARATRYGQPFTVLTIAGRTHEAIEAPRLMLKQWLRQVDFAGDLGNVLAVVLPNTARAGAASVTERLRKLAPDVDIRIAQYPVDGATLAQLVGDDEWHTTAAVVGGRR